MNWLITFLFSDYVAPILIFVGGVTIYFLTTVRIRKSDPVLPGTIPIVPNAVAKYASLAMIICGLLLIVLKAIHGH